MLSILPILPTPLATLLSSDTKAIRKTNHGYIGRIDNPLCGNTLHVTDVVIRRRNMFQNSTRTIERWLISPNIIAKAWLSCAEVEWIRRKKCIRITDCIDMHLFHVNV